MSLLVIPPNGTQEISDTNWRNVVQNLISGPFNPTPTLTGYTAPGLTGTGLTYNGYYAIDLQGVLRFNIIIQPTSGVIAGTWTSTAFLILPRTVPILGSISTTLKYYPYGAVPVYNISAGTVLGNVVINNQTINSKVYGALQPQVTITGGGGFISIQGFYFTGK